MAYTRPMFPVLENIVGVKKWAASKSALKSMPDGLRVAGQEISIQLDRNIDHPLFRFCLELFSIIPKKCVDLDKNKIICKDIPISGPYRIAKKSKDTYLFVKREGPILDDVPQRIQFEYVAPDILPKKLESLDELTVIAGGEVAYSISDLKLIEKKLTTKFAPASRFSMLLLNPEVEPFKNIKCRRYFAGEFRKAYANLADKSQPMEASIFTKILPGYLSVQDLEKSNVLSSKDIADCKTVFSKAEIRWAHTQSNGHTMFVNTLRNTISNIGAKLPEPILTANRKENENLFTAGKISVLHGSSGFWALDPAGDLKMLLTPNLHEMLEFVTANPTTQNLVAGLQDESADYTKMNRYLFEQADLNVYTHLRRFFASPNKALLADLPIAISSPAPWQVFEVK